MATVVTINRPDVAAHIEALAARSTGGSKTEVVALALPNLDERDARVGSLFGAHRGSVTVREGVDLTIPILEDAMVPVIVDMPMVLIGVQFGAGRRVGHDRRVCG